MSPHQTGTTAGTATGTATPPGSEYLPEVLRQLLRNTPPWLVDLLQSVVVLVVAYVASRLLVRLLGRRIARRFRRPSITRTVLRGIRAGVAVFAILTILAIYGYQLSDLVLQVTVFTAILGVVLAPIVGSVISGVFLLADQPYEIGDMVELVDSGQRGFVEDITLRYTKIFTLDNTFLVIPNGTIRERDVVNYSAEDTRTRQTLDLLVTYESDIERARELFENAARKVDGVVEGGPGIRVGAARYPAGPTCYIDAYADHGVNLRLRYWIEEPYWLLRMRSRIQTALWEAIEDEDIEIAYPHQHQVFDDTSGTMQVSLVDGEPETAGPSQVRRPESGGRAGPNPPNGGGLETDTGAGSGREPDHGGDTRHEPDHGGDGGREREWERRPDDPPDRGQNVDPGLADTDESPLEESDDTDPDDERNPGRSGESDDGPASR